MLLILLFQTIFALVRFVPHQNVTYNNNAIEINGKSELLMVGHIHYARSTPEMWPKLFQLTKEAGLNAIDTYVFWNDHEIERGKYDFKGRKDLRKFLKTAWEYGLYVVLRVGPYVCAEWNYGGFPAWLREIDGIDFRSFNKPFMREMARYIKNTFEYVKDLSFSNGGPIILLQVENEYGLVQKEYGDEALPYMNWAVEFVKSLETSLPLFVCVQDNIPSVINTCNGFYCDNWLRYSRPYQDQPGMFTENWSGWFSTWGDVIPKRPTEDLAFGVARWFAYGGTYNAYYMWHGGTNFARTAGYNITTSYDYDAPLDEYGMPNEPKFSHLKKLHQVIFKFKDLLLENNRTIYDLGSEIEAVVYGSFDSEKSLVFLLNNAASGSENVEFMGNLFKIPRWSVTIIQGPASRPNILFNSAKIKTPKSVPFYSPVLTLSASRVEIKTVKEQIGIWNNDATIYKTVPHEQIAVTRDKTDYLWYILDDAKLPPSTKEIILEFEEVQDFLQVYWDDESVYQGRGGYNLRIRFPVDHVNYKQSLKILTSTLGLTNFGGHRQHWNRGIVGRVYLNGKDVTENGWIHQLGGLSGEYHLYNANSTLFKSIETANQPLTWYQIKFPKFKPRKDSHYAFDFGSMGKGLSWINGEEMGRYWNITSKLPVIPTDPYPKPESLVFQLEKRSDQQKTCDYAGPFFPDKCRNGKEGVPTQRYYHVPNEWFNTDYDNYLVLFEEIGGNPKDVKLVEVSRKLLE